MKDKPIGQAFIGGVRGIARFWIKHSSSARPAPLAAQGSFIGLLSLPVYNCGTYCNRASTGWYSVDKQPCQTCQKP